MPRRNRVRQQARGPNELAGNCLGTVEAGLQSSIGVLALSGVEGRIRRAAAGHCREAAGVVSARTIPPGGELPCRGRRVGIFTDWGRWGGGPRFLCSKPPGCCEAMDGDEDDNCAQGPVYMRTYQPRVVPVA